LGQKQGELAKVQTEKTSLTTQLKNLEEEKKRTDEKARVEKNTLTSQLTTAKHTLEEQRGLINSLKVKNGELEFGLQTAELVERELKKQIKRASELRQKVQKELTNEKKEHNQTRTERGDLVTKNRSQETKITGLQDQERELRDSLEQKEEKVVKLEGKIMGLNNTLNEAQQTWKVEKEKLTETNKELELAVQTWELAQKETKKQLQKENKKLKTQLETERVSRPPITHAEYQELKNDQLDLARIAVELADERGYKEFYQDQAKNLAEERGKLEKQKKELQSDYDQYRNQTNAD